MEPESGTASDQPNSALVIDGVYKGYGSNAARVSVIENFSLLALRGQFVTLIGPSGCGKTTLLRIVAGLLEVDRGTVSIFGQSVQRASAAKHIGLVPQSPALLPWRTVLDNVRLPLQVNKKPDSDGSRCLSRSAWGTSSTAGRLSCRAGCSTESRSHARLSSIRRSC